MIYQVIKRCLVYKSGRIIFQHLFFKKASEAAKTGFSQISTSLPSSGLSFACFVVAVELALRINEQLMKIVQELSSTDLEKSPLSLR